MKNYFFFTLLSFFFASSMAFAQCPVTQGCHEVDINFPISGNGVDISSLPNWTYSHGSPSIGSGGFWLWSYNNNGEGINYSGYNFVAGQMYKICFAANTSTHDGSAPNPAATFNIVGTNGPVNGFNSATSSSPIPTPPLGSMSIVSANWNATFPNPGSGTYTYTFTATSNFNNLWFYPSSSTLPQVEIGITSIVICEMEPCDASFTVCLRDQGNGTSAITTSLNNSNHTITGMRIWENNVLIYSGPHVSYLGAAGNTYRICITAVNNNTGEECMSCYTFCIGKETADEKSNSGTLIHSTLSDDKTSNMPEEFKDKPLEKDLGVTISPNPSSRMFEVSSSSTEIKMTSVKVFDLNSRQVYSSEPTENQNNTRIDLKDQPAGIYIVKIQYSDGSISQQKIVLEK
ncbi:MAG: hypothetical protein COA38_00480 [Fluviicola sp.]|nr:MAG: hypothetical protein COA38_00480 [Fluviicola sp.]